MGAEKSAGENDGYSNWKRVEANSSNIVRIGKLGAVVSLASLRQTENWIMDASVYDPDATVARSLQGAGFNMSIHRQIRNKPSDTDRVMIFGNDQKARDAFWEIADMPDIVELSTDPVGDISAARPEILEMVDGIVYEVANKAS
jgi:hypothetical protein